MDLREIEGLEIDSIITVAEFPFLIQRMHIAHPGGPLTNSSILAINDVLYFEMGDSYATPILNTSGNPMSTYDLRKIAMKRGMVKQ